jgi:ketosteroid isomerase-like protein
MTHPNVEAMRKSDEAFANGDLDGAFALYHDDVVVHVSGRSNLAGDYAGRDGYLEFVGSFIERYSPKSFENLAYFADDEYGITLARSTAAKGDRTFERQVVIVMRFRDGKVSEVWPFNSDQAALDEWLA